MHHHMKSLRRKYKTLRQAREHLVKAFEAALWQQKAKKRERNKPYEYNGEWWVIGDDNVRRPYRQGGQAQGQAQGEQAQPKETNPMSGQKPKKVPPASPSQEAIMQQVFDAYERSGTGSQTMSQEDFLAQFSVLEGVGKRGLVNLAAVMGIAGAQRHSARTLRAMIVQRAVARRGASQRSRLIDRPRVDVSQSEGHHFHYGPTPMSEATRARLRDVGRDREAGHPFVGLSRQEVEAELLRVTGAAAGNTDPWNLAHRPLPDGLEEAARDVMWSLRAAKARSSFSAPAVGEIVGMVMNRHGWTKLDAQALLVQMASQRAIRLYPFTRAFGTAPDPASLIPLDREAKGYVDTVGSVVAT